MRCATVTSTAGTTAAAWKDGEWRALPAPDLSSLLRSGTEWELGDAVAGAVPVLPLPTAGKVICCGLNYGDHIAETGRETPTHPTLFAKYADTLIGPTDDITVPAGLEVDWEAELAVVVGGTLKNASPAEAQRAIAGYTVANDISMRAWQFRALSWRLSKGQPNVVAL